MARFYRRLTILLLALVTTSQCARSEILHVDPVNGPYFTIQSAVDDAESLDVVELVPHVYDELVRLVNQQITIRSVDGPVATIWDGAGKHRLVLASYSDLTLEGITLRNGWTDIGGGGAVRARHSTLTVGDCVFRHNEVSGDADDRTQGGAIYVSGAYSAIRIDNSLFVENQTHGYLGNGGAIGFTKFDSGFELGAGPPGSPPHEEKLLDGSMRIEDCTFLRNISGWDGSCVADWVSDVLLVRRCLFVENRRLGGQRTGGLFTRISGETVVTCSLIWEDSSPQFDERDGMAKGASTNFIADPRLCPDDPETVHESSPTLDREGCNTIGNLPVGCSGPMVLAVRANPLNPEPSQVVRIYGYGLDRVDGAEIESPSGDIRPGGPVHHDDAWLSVVLDLTGAEPGEWTLRLLEAGQLVVELEDPVTVLPFTVLAFRDPWVENRERQRLYLAHRGWTEGLDLDLVHAESGESIWILDVRPVAPDTLRLSVDLLEAPTGMYDLEVRGETIETRIDAVLYFGAPPVVGVPDDYETISEAVAAAPPGAQILIAAGEYRETVVVDRPVRLMGRGWGTHVLPPAEEPDRCFHVLESAGRITHLEGLKVEKGTLTTGSGAGILADVPVTVRGCYVFNNRARDGNGGGAWLAPGSRVLGSWFYGNTIDGGESGVVTDPLEAPRDVGGGLFCHDCLVEDTEFGGNHAPCTGAAAVRGVFRDNYLSDNWAEWSDGDGIDAVAAQGVITGNRFENACGSVAPPVAFFQGPSAVSYNTFSNYWWDLCAELDLLQIQGPVDFFQNTLAGTRLQVCTHTQIPPGSEDRIRIYNNLIESGSTHWPDIFYCQRRLVDGPVFEIPETSIEYECNLGDEIAIFSPDGYQECPDCVYEVYDLGFCETPYTDGYWSYGEFDLRLRNDSPALPENSPFGCPDILGAQPVGCGVSPVLVSGARVVMTAQGAELTWTMSPDVSVDGFEIVREHDGRAMELTAEPLPPCLDCRYLDRDALRLAGPVEYRLTILWSDGHEDVVPLGGLDLEGLREVLLDGPRPNPMAAAAQVSFYLPERFAARVELIDVAGRVVMKLAEGWMDPGRHVLSLDRESRRLTSGVYWIRLTAGGRSLTERLVVVR